MNFTYLVLALFIILVLSVTLWLTVGKSSSDNVQARQSSKATEPGSQLSHVVLACNNSRYFQYWPDVYLAWKNRIGIEPVLVYVDKNPPPVGTAHISNVRWFPAIEGVSTVFTSQCVRLLYPGYGDLPGGPSKRIIISDMDIVPMDPEWFHNMAERTPESMMTNYRPDALAKEKEIPMCYVAARREVWQALFPDAEDMAKTLQTWYEKEQDWCVDQRKLFQALRKDNPDLEYTESFPALRRLDKPQVCSISQTDDLPLASDSHLPVYENCPSVIHRLATDDRLSEKYQTDE